MFAASDTLTFTAVAFSNPRERVPAAAVSETLQVSRVIGTAEMGPDHKDKNFGM